MLDSKSNKVHTVLSDATLWVATNALLDLGIGCVIVTYSIDGNLAGILSERDVVRAVATHGEAALKKPVSDFMTAKVITSKPSDSIMRLTEVMRDNKLRHLPIVDSNRICGLISMRDIVHQTMAQTDSSSEAIAS